MEQILLLLILMKLRIIALNSITLIIRELGVQNLKLLNPECRECGLLLITECCQGTAHTWFALVGEVSYLSRAVQGLLARRRRGKV